MDAGEKLGLEQIRAFLESTDGVGFAAERREGLYSWVNQLLREQDYERQSRAAKGLLRRYVAKMTGLSRAQLTRLIGLYLAGDPVQVRPYRRRRFASRYTRADIELLAEVDQAHQTLSGPATQKLLYRTWHDFKDARFERLGAISAAHIYNLRRTGAYHTKHIRYHSTKPTQVNIGQRRAPQPQGRAGYLRVDTVHQGDEEGAKGVYHINAVDQVTQWQIVSSTVQISEAWLMPVLEAMLEQFPFRIRGFHSDNGSEFINHTVAKLLNKLLVEQTKSRPRRSNDNGLVEAKNGAVIRKHMGYLHIAAGHAEALQQFYQQHFNPYLNFHRPCGQPELRANLQGKIERVYNWYATPWEMLRRLPGLAGCLKPEITGEMLEQQARALTDTEAANRMQEAKCKLFASFQRKRA
jgi:transposase InsO family protein